MTGSPRAGRPLAEGEGQLLVQILEFLGDLAPRIPGELVERDRHHGLAALGRGVEQRRDGLDGGRPVTGFDDRVKHLVAAVERLLEGVGDLPAGGGVIVISHDDERRTRRSECRPRDRPAPIRRRHHRVLQQTNGSGIQRVDLEIGDVGPQRLVEVTEQRVPQEATSRSVSSSTGLPAHPHSTVRSLSSVCRLTPWSTPYTPPSTPARM